MLEQLIYQNHINEVFEFGKEGIFVNYNDLHDYEWEVQTKNNRITNLSKPIAEKSLPVVVMCNSKEEGIAKVNRLMEITEKDCYSLQPGKVIVGGYYFKCFVIRSEKAQYLINKRHMLITLTLESDYPVWVKETTTNFRSESSGSEAFLDYPYDFAFDYTNALGRKAINNPGFMPSDFIAIIYGACVNPQIVIANHVYQVMGTIDEGEYLTINTQAKTITKTAVSGVITNKFNDRNRESYIFEKIPAGTNPVAWVGDFGFDITLMEERSEPRWI